MKKDDRYSVVRFNARKELGISIAEYVFCDMVYHLAASKKAKIEGWSTMALDYYAENLGITRRGVMLMRDRMIERDLIERHPTNQMGIRTTVTWEETTIEGVNKVHLNRGEQSSPEVGTKFTPPVNKVHSKGEESSPHDNKVSKDSKDISKDREREAHAQEIEIEDDVLTAALVTKKLSCAGLNGDCPASRRKIWEIVEPYLDTDDFNSQFNFYADGLPKVDGRAVMLDWVITGPYYDVKEFKFNKIRGWIRTAGQQKPSSNATTRNQSSTTGSTATRLTTPDSFLAIVERAREKREQKERGA